MNKKYIAPSVEIVNVNTMAMIALSIQAGTNGEGDHDASSKTINFADDSDSFWSTEE